MNPFGILSIERLTGQRKSDKTRHEGKEKTTAQSRLLKLVNNLRGTPPPQKISTYTAYRWPEYSPALSSSFLQRLHISPVSSKIFQGESHNIYNLPKQPYTTSDHREGHAASFGIVPAASLKKHFTTYRRRH